MDGSGSGEPAEPTRKADTHADVEIKTPAGDVAGEGLGISTAEAGKDDTRPVADLGTSTGTEGAENRAHALNAFWQLLKTAEYEEW